MGNFSRSTFDRLKHYVGVRQQMGVPLVDADWNEMEDIRKHELQTFLRLFIGSGIPKDNNGFRIAPVEGVANDFVITGGNGQLPGYCIVDGMDVLNENDLHYSDQVLFENESLPALITPAVDRTDTVYLDIWEREVDSDDDSELINPLIEEETCVRIKREWRVRVAEGVSTAPVNSNDGHVYYTLALLHRPEGLAEIMAEHIEDRRQTGLAVGSWIDVRQITRDAFGDSYRHDQDGEPNLKVSLRSAFNDLLQGLVPMSSPMQVTIDPSMEGKLPPQPVTDSLGDTWVFWGSERNANRDILYKHYSHSNQTWGPETFLTDDPAVDAQPKPLIDANGQLWVFWVSTRTGNNDIWYNRYSSTGGWSGEQRITTDTGPDGGPAPVVDHDGNIWVFWHAKRDNNYDIWSNCYNVAKDTWDGETRHTTATERDVYPNVVVDRDGDIHLVWASYRSENYDIWYKHYNYLEENWGDEEQLTTDVGRDFSPIIVSDLNRNLWVFWWSDRTGTNTSFYKRYNQLTKTWTDDLQLTTDVLGGLYAIVDSANNVWVFWRSERTGKQDIWFNVYRHCRGAWDGDRLLTTDMTEHTNGYASAIVDTNDDIGVFWYRAVGEAAASIWHRKLITKI
jgi:hypothetical protein